MASVMLSSDLRELKQKSMACADCGAAGPEWACINLGILVCIDCSGVHRNLGSHISKVRSLVLDTKVWTPHMLSLYNRLGNEKSNQIWEHSMPEAIKPKPKTAKLDKAQFIQRKYGTREFAKRSGLDTDVVASGRVLDAVRSGKLSALVQCLAEFGPMAMTDAEPKQNLIHAAVELGDVALMQFLTLNGVSWSSADITHAEDKWGSNSDISRLMLGLKRI